MLPKACRLRRGSDFRRVRRTGSAAGDPLVVLYVCRSNSLTVRIGFSVSKRVGKAATRNRVKRRLRETLRADLGDLADGQDLVFVAKPASGGASRAQLEEAVTRVLRRSGTRFRNG